jgi:hypothetical protein
LLQKKRLLCIDQLQAGDADCGAILGQDGFYQIRGITTPK